MKKPLLLAALLTLTACATTTGQASTPPAPTFQSDVNEFCPAFTPLAAVAPLPGSDSPFVWECWTGDWDELELMENLGDLLQFGPDTPEWSAFRSSLSSAFPRGVNVYRLELPCENCHQWAYLLHGDTGTWTGGFSGRLFWDY